MATCVERAVAFEESIDEILALYHVRYLIFLPPSLIPRTFLEHTIQIQMRLLQSQKDVPSSAERNVSIYSNQTQEIETLQQIVREISETFYGTETSSAIDDYRKFRKAKFKYCGVQGFRFK